MLDSSKQPLSFASGGIFHLLAALREIEIQISGKRYRGTYRVEGVWINVVSGDLVQNRRLGSMLPTMVARKLLEEMVREGRTTASD